MDVGDYNVGAGGIFPKLGNDGMSFGDGYMCIYREFGLGMPS